MPNSFHKCQAGRKESKSSCSSRQVLDVSCFSQHH